MNFVEKLKDNLVADKLIIGINYFYLNSVENVNLYIMNFLNEMTNQRKALISHCNKSRYGCSDYSDVSKLSRV